MLTKFRSTIYKIINESVNQQLDDVTDCIKNKINNVVIKNNQIYLIGDVELINQQLDELIKCVKSVIGASNKKLIDEDLQLFYPNIIEIDSRWLHGKTRDEIDTILPGNVDVLGDNIDVEGKWSSLRDENHNIIVKMSLTDLKKTLVEKFKSKEDSKKLFILVVSTMINAKSNTISNN